MKTIIEIENGNIAYANFENGTRIILGENEIKKINEIIKSSFDNCFEEKKEETPKTNQDWEKTSLRQGKIVKRKDTKGEYAEKFNFISKLFREGLKDSEITDQLVKKFGIKYNTAVWNIRAFRKLVGKPRNEKDQLEFNMYVADKNYEIQDYTDIVEKFGITEQRAKQAVFYLRTVYYGEAKEISRISIK